VALSEEEMTYLIARGLLTEAQAAGIRQALKARPQTAKASAPAPAWRGKFDMLHVAYFFGAMLVMGAMAFFVTVAWEALGGFGIAAVAIAYAATFVLVGRRLYQQPDLVIPGGLLITMAVAMMPLATYGLERALGLWPGVDPGQYRGFHEWIRSGWLGMEVVTIAAAALALRWFRFPFLTLPLAFTLWYLSMDATPLIAGPDSVNEARQWVSMGFGLATLGLGALMELRWHEDFGYWMYRFGLLAFFGGLLGVAFHEDYPLPWGTGLRLIAGLLGLATAVYGSLKARSAFMASGSLAMLTYAGHLAWTDNNPHYWGGLAYGLLVAGLAFAYGQDERVQHLRSHRDRGYDFAAVLILWSAAGLTYFHDPEWQKALYVPVCLLAMVVSVVLQQRAFILFGGIGLMVYIGHLAAKIFADSLLFPFVLSGIGLGIIALAVAYRKHQRQWREAILAQLPPWLVLRLPVAEELMPH
jgi:hypothetical protein